MKRYRVLAFDFDTRQTILATEIQPGWEPAVKENWEENKRNVREELLQEYGSWNGERKLADFVALEPKPLSVVSYHNQLFDQARRAFVSGGYYPALTAACALGERTLNHLVLAVRRDYKATPEYRKVRAQESFNDWNVAIDVLSEWGVLLEEPVRHFRELAQIRHRKAIHFNRDADVGGRALALEALTLLSSIIRLQFGSEGMQPWYIPVTRGEIYVRSASEKEPFVREFVLPSCRQVGFKHEIQIKGRQIWASDPHEYEAREVSDEEFMKLREVTLRPVQ